MHPKDADGTANRVDPDQTAPLGDLIWVCTVCPDLSVRKLRIITVVIKVFFVGYDSGGWLGYMLEKLTLKSIIYHKNPNKHPPPQFGFEKLSVFCQFLEKYQPLINAHWRMLADKDNLMT